jgi:hypothetical protein
MTDTRGDVGSISQLSGQARSKAAKFSSGGNEKPKIHLDDPLNINMKLETPDTFKLDSHPDTVSIYGSQVDPNVNGNFIGQEPEHKGNAK